mgnify:FL=1
MSDCAPSEGYDKAGARISRAPVKSNFLSFFILIAGYITVSMFFSEAKLYAPLVGGIPVMWWTGVIGKSLGVAVMAALIGYRLKVLGRDWRSAGWGEVQPLKELLFALGCAAGVWAISFLFLSEHANQGAIASHAHEDLKSASGWWLAFLSSCVLTGIREDLVYRGGLRAFMAVGTGGSPKDDLRFALVSGVVFAAGHWLASPGAYVVYVLMGAVFAATLVRSGSLRAVMLAHILVNTAHLYGLGNYVRYVFGWS